MATIRPGRLLLAMLASCTATSPDDADDDTTSVDATTLGTTVTTSMPTATASTATDDDEGSDGSGDGSDTSTGADVPPIPMGAWTRLDPGGSGPYGPYFYRSVVLADGDVWLGWGQPTSGDGNFVFDAATNVWVRTNEAVDDPTKNIGSRENYGAWYDGDRHCIWIGDGVPVAYGNPEGAQSGDLRYDVATDTFSLAYPNFGPPPNAIGRADAALVYHADALYSFGGWQVGPTQRLVRRDLTSDEVTELAVATTPSFTQEPAMLTYARAGVDTRTGELWALADDGELWRIDPAAATPAWEHVPTTGDKPGSSAYVAALHESADIVVAWLGRDGLVSDGQPEVGRTLLLDLQTLAWGVGPSLEHGDEVPKSLAMAGNVMSYDAANERIVMTVAGEYTQVWAFSPAR